MWPRVGLIFSLVIAPFAITATPAWAPCMATTPDIVHEAEAVWWATVIEATPANGGAAVDMTVRIYDVLKGPGVVGATAVVTRPGIECGPFTMHVTDGAVRRLVGDQLLLSGTFDGEGHLDASSEINEPDLTPEEQYHRALAALGLDDRDPPPHVSEFPDETGVSWWIIPAGVVLLLLATLGAVLIGRSRRHTA